MPRLPIVLQLACVLSAGCAPHGDSGTVFQNSTIDALLDGNYDGEITIGELLRHGDFGLGTFDDLDGEMIVLDGVCYQVRADGRARVADDRTETPLGVVTRFAGGRGVKISAGGLSELKQAIDRLRHADGHAYTLKVRGRFAAMRVRSVPRQARPFRPLAEVVKEQSVFDLKDVSGTMVGFWFPESMSHVNVPGYHFHFISDDRTAGGHVLDVTIDSAEVAVQPISRITIALLERQPTTRPGGGGRVDELKAAEKQTR